MGCNIKKKRKGWLNIKEKITNLMLSQNIRLISWKNEQGKEVIEFAPRVAHVRNWVELLDRFGRIFEGEFAYSSQNGKVILSFASDRRYLLLLKSVLEAREYEYSYHHGSGEVFDIKLGFSCNNNCIHCVIKPNIWDMKEKNPDSIVLDSGFGMHCSCDLSYEQVIEVIDCHPIVSTYVLTGGEPTVRSDFLKILQWLYYSRPNSAVTIQSNGRAFADLDFARATTRYIRYPSAAIAVHGNEETHNAIVNNRKDHGNPFQETMKGIRNLLRLFGPNAIRTEMVLSKRNVDDIFDSVRYQHEDLGVRMIGISYPHLCGFPEEIIQLLAPSMQQLVPLIINLNQYVLTHPDLEIYIEAVPWCVFVHNIEGDILLKTFEMTSMEHVKTSMLGELRADFPEVWANDHVKPEWCSECLYNGLCVGVWEETAYLNFDAIKPITAIDPQIEHFIDRCKRRDKGE